ncbi:MAG TPA: ABC transporter ATP-binding protein [Isosphaeraceae bacterium]|nr:ABC transporter ATP-binding protein [Isosphaeraceae bacterium]
MEAAPEEKLLEVEGLSKVFRVRRGLVSTPFAAVDGVSFSLSAERHEILTLAGESGSGKTTLARMILGLIPPTGGRLLFRGRDVTRLSDAERRTWFRREVQAVFQDPYATFNPLRRVESYLYETAVNFQVARRAEADEPIERALNAVGLSLKEVRGRYPSELSGGQLQRIAIARALITGPSLLVADEPVSMLDASLRMAIVNLFRELKGRQSLIYITHDLATAYYASDRVAIMLRGWIVELGPVEKVLGNPLHPYTRLLRSAILEPDPSRRRERMAAAVPPDAREPLGVGCRFVHRCPLAMEICRRAVPPDVLSDGRLVRCHLYRGEAGDGRSEQGAAAIPGWAGQPEAGAPDPTGPH